MARTTYTTHLSGLGTFRFSADLVEASETIHTDDGEGNWSPTQFTTANASHGRRAALKLALLASGREYFASSDDDRDSDEIIEDLIEGADIEADEPEEEDDLVTLETMPDYHRQSHRDANNWGRYPHTTARPASACRAMRPRRLSRATRTGTRISWRNHDSGRRYMRRVRRQSGGDGGRSVMGLLRML